MADERQRSALKVLYDEVLLAFEEALDKAEDLKSLKPGSHLRKVKTWLENATSSLISWGIDARTDTGSLSAVEGTPLENEVRCTLYELQGQLEKIYEKRSFREEVSSLPELTTSVVPELLPISCGDGLAADEDPMAIMSSLIGALQDTVRPIRMIHASRKQEGPYRDLKRQIDNIYNQQIERRDRSEPWAPESPPSIALLEDDPSNAPANVKDILSHYIEPSVSPQPTGTVSPSVEGSITTKPGPSGEDLHQNSGPTDENKAFHLDLSESEDFWGDVGVVIRNNCQRNWKGAHFITPKTLFEIMSDETVTRLLQSVGTEPQEINHTNFVRRVIADCRKVLAICLYARLGPSFFYLLTDSPFSDENLPLGDKHSQKFLSHITEDSDLKSLQRFRDSQWAFSPIRLVLNQPHVQLGESAVLPLQYNPEQDLIGRGAFSRVYSVRIHPDLHHLTTRDERFAFKRFSGLPDVNTTAIDSKRMLKQMSMLNHPNLVQQLSTWSSGPETFILFPMGDTNLQRLMDQERPPISLSDQAKLLEQFYHITCATRFLHDHNSSQATGNQFIRNRQTSFRGVHMDIKPQNILIFHDGSHTGTWKMADFGIAEVQGISYASPDLFSMPSQIASDQSDLGRQYDVWALGCILLEILSWISGGEYQNLRRQLSELGELWYKPTPSDTAELKPEIVAALTELRQTHTGIFLFNGILDLVRSTLEVDHKRRPNISEVENRLAGILAQMPGSSYIHRLQDAVAEATETESLDGSDKSFVSDGDDQSGAQTPDTVDSTFEDTNFQVRAKWQTRRMYPLLLQGVEPEPLHDEIVTTLARHTRSKLDFRSPGGRNRSGSTVLQQAILRSLSFPSMRARENDITVAHEGTFAWVFEDPHSPFLQWLNGNGDDENGFWINGKVGSGKSTLMSYIARNHEQRHSSGAQNRGSPLVKITHFFWAAGNAMQKSHLGFLRSLLHQLLRERSDLLPKLLADLWEVATKYTADFLQSLPEAWHGWSPFQLKRLLGDLLALLDREDRFLLLIDALDECDHDDFEDIVALIRQLSSTQNFKVCYTSRPCPMIMEAFHSAPGFLLQNLTRCDIELYVKDQMDRMLLNTGNAVENESVDSMVTKIVDKASGMFLWVILVLDSLFQGISDGDTTSDMQKRLDFLPPSLENLYDMVLKSIATQAQIEASMFFQVVAKSPKPLSLTALKFAVAEEDVTIEQASKNLMSEDSHDEILRGLLSCCGVLLEVRSTDPGSESVVTLIHSTVKEYLERPLTWNTHERCAARRGFDANVALLRASVFQVHTMMASNPDWNEWKYTIELAMNYAREAEETTGQAQTALLDSLDRVVGGAMLPSLLPGDNLPPSKIPVHWSAAAMHGFAEDSCDYCPDSFLAFAVVNGLTLYVTSKISRMPAKAKAVKKSLLFYATIASWKHYPSLPIRVPMAKALLEHGADPNEKFGEFLDLEKTPWELILEYLALECDEDHRDLWLNVCDLFLCYGADPQAHVLVNIVDCEDSSDEHTDAAHEMPNSRDGLLSVSEVMNLAFSGLSGFSGFFKESPLVLRTKHKSKKVL